MVTREEVITAIDNTIVEQSTPDRPQLRYLDTMETMMGFVDERMRDGAWRVLRTAPERPFVIGDAPVVTWERNEHGELILGQGFAKPNAEVFLPFFPTACLHILPAVERTRRVLAPSADEVNRAQAAFSTLHCFTSIESKDIDAVLQPWFGTIRLGREGFNLDHVAGADKLFEILMNQPPPPAGALLA